MPTRFVNCEYCGTIVNEWKLAQHKSSYCMADHSKVIPMERQYYTKKEFDELRDGLIQKCFERIDNPSRYSCNRYSKSIGTTSYKSISEHVKKCFPRAHVGLRDMSADHIKGYFKDRVGKVEEPDDRLGKDELVARYYTVSSNENNTWYECNVCGRALSTKCHRSHLKSHREKCCGAAPHDFRKQHFSHKYNNGILQYECRYCSKRLSSKSPTHILERHVNSSKCMNNSNDYYPFYD